MNVGYYGTGTNNNWMDHEAMNDFWHYDDQSDAWNQLPDYTGGGTQYASSFSLNDKGYILGGTYLKNTEDGVTFDHKSVFMRFDPVTGNWESIAPYPGKGKFGLTGIAMDNTALVGAGSRIPDGEYYNFIDNKDFWIYNPSNNSWKETTSLDHNTSMSQGFFVGNKAYLYSTDALYRLGTSNWQRFSPTQHYSQYAISFVIGNTGYYGLGSVGVAGSSVLWAYNTENDRFISYPSPTRLYHSSVFVVNEKAYIIGGIDSYMPTKIVWEFDPSKPDL